MTNQTQADRFAAMFDNDGECFVNRGGQGFHQVIQRMAVAAEVQEGDPLKDLSDPELTRFRWIFDDGSCIVSTVLRWDHEGTERFSMDFEEDDE